MLIDEAARVSDELYRSVRPFLAVADGDLWLMSTPFGKRGFFYEEWENGGPRWTRFKITAPECPRITGGVGGWDVADAGGVGDGAGTGGRVEGDAGAVYGERS